MKESNDLIKKFGVDKILHGLIGMLILAVCMVASVFLFGVSFLSVLGGMVWRNMSSLYRLWGILQLITGKYGYLLQDGLYA